MPVLLAQDAAPLLPDLLRAANHIGIACDIAGPDRAMPRICGLGSLSGAGASEISFLANDKRAAELLTCRAAAVVLTREAWQALSTQHSPSWHAVICPQPYLMYALLAQWFEQQRLHSMPISIHPSAVIDEHAHIAHGVSIAAHCVVEAGARIGAGSRLGAGCIIGADSVVGKDSLLHARVTLYHGVRLGERCIVHSGAVLGADGFGFAPMPGGQGAWAKIAQLGGVVVGDDVEIGANTTIDRGALEDTRVGNGVKLDNQIMIAHNVVIGEHTAMAACVGIAGSTRIGARCTIGGAAMLSGHLTLVDDVHVSGGTAITASIHQAGRYTGVYPFDEHRQWQRNAAVLGQLAPLRQRLRRLEDSRLAPAAPIEK